MSNFLFRIASVDHALKLYRNKQISSRDIIEAFLIAMDDCEERNNQPLSNLCKIMARDILFGRKCSSWDQVVSMDKGNQ